VVKLSRSRKGNGEPVRSAIKSPGALNALQRLAFGALEDGDPKKALLWAKKALSQTLEGHLPYAECLQLITFVSIRLGRFVDAIASAEEARSIHLDHGEIGGMAECDSLIAYSLQRAGRTREALDKLESSRVLYLEAGDDARAAECAAVAKHWTQGRETGMVLSRVIL
jgi:tetratricopeptide (TPR) repeat protein